MIANCPGFTWAYIDEHIDIPRLLAMRRHWRKAPPVHLLVRDFVGYKAPILSEGVGEEIAALPEYEEGASGQA